MTTNLIPNGDFQAGWQTNPATGDQTPNGWDLTILPNGSPQLWPTKGAWSEDRRRRIVVTATVERQPECVFKLSNQLPPNERFDGGDSLLFIPNGQVYKRFHGPSSTVLSRRITGLIPLAPVRFKGYMLAKPDDQPRGPDGLLESDHCRVRMFCGQEKDERTWNEMKDRHDYDKSALPWNRFELLSSIGVDGTIVVGNACQQNWPDDPGGVAFFQGPMWMEYTDAQPEPPTPPPPQPGTVNALRNAALAMQERARVMVSSGNMIVAEASDMILMLDKMIEAQE